MNGKKKPQVVSLERRWLVKIFCHGFYGHPGAVLPKKSKQERVFHVTENGVRFVLAKRI